MEQSNLGFSANVIEAATACLQRLNQAFACKEVEAGVALFAPKPEVVFVGSDESERAIGPEEVREVLAFLFALPETFQWKWEDTAVSEVGGLTLLSAWGVVGEAEQPQSDWAPYRLTGVLEPHEGNLRWLQFHGSVPVTEP